MAWTPPESDDRDAAEETPKGFSALTIALILAGSLCLGCAPCGVLATLLMPALLRAKERANEAKAKNALRQIALGRALIRDSLDGRDSEPTLADLAERDLIDAELVDGEAHDYRFEIKPGAGPDGWRAIAEPFRERARVRRLIVDPEGTVTTELSTDPPGESTPGESTPGRPPEADKARPLEPERGG